MDNKDTEKLNNLINLKKMYEEIIAGTITVTTDGKRRVTKSFESRKKELEEKIKNAKKNNSSISLEQAETELIENEKSLERYDHYFGKEKDQEAEELYNKAMETKSKEDIMSAYHKINALSGSKAKEDYKEMYLKGLNALSIVNSIDIQKELEKEEADKNLSEVSKSLELLKHYNFASNQEVEELYNKAMETHTAEDIINAYNKANEIYGNATAGPDRDYKEAYIGGLESLATINSVDIQKELNKKQAEVELEKANKHISTLKDSFKNQPNNQPNQEVEELYNKAMETHSMEDIKKAYNKINAWDVSGNVFAGNYKEDFLTGLKAMEAMYSEEKHIDNIEKLERKYEKLLEAESKIAKSATKLLEKTNKLIEEMQNVDVEQKESQEVKLDNQVEQTQVKDSEMKMLAKGNLEDNYYDRLANAANEKPIFKDADNFSNIQEEEKKENKLGEKLSQIGAVISEKKANLSEWLQNERQEQQDIEEEVEENEEVEKDVDFDLTPDDYKPNIITKISKAPAQLIEKVKDSKFVQTLENAIDFMKQHKLAVATASLAAAAALGVAAHNNSESEKSQDNNQSNYNIDLNQIDKELDKIEEKDSEELSSNEEMGQVLGDILIGDNSMQYTDADTYVTYTADELEQSGKSM